MELTNDFVIDRGVEETWRILNNLEFIAPCMPGAQLQEIEGDEYRGIVKIKVGPITAQYKGKASFIEQDATNKVAKLKAEGRDPRQGNANALITASMVPVGDTQTSVTIHTDLGLSGKIASFGRGAIEDVSKKILGQFSDNLRQKLENEGSASTPDTPQAAAGPVASAAAAVASPAVADAAAAAGEQAAAAASAAADAGGAAGDKASTAAADVASAVGEKITAAVPDVAAPAAAASTIRKIDAPEPEPVDLLAVSGGTLAKRLVPAAGGLAVLAAVLYWLLGRG